MAFSRHNIEKRRLIELVRQNPILWDCRLPHYKSSDKKKATKWNELGCVFNVTGERVQRTFTSLREIFRRELNHEKMLGTTRFKSKWEYYDAMAFLKKVIRERKSRERVKHTAEPTASTLSSNNNNNNSTNNNNNNSSSVGHDEYQYFAPSDPNNPNNQQQQLAVKPLASPNVPAAQLSQLSQQAQHLQALQLQPDVTLTTLQKQATPTGQTVTSTAATPVVTVAAASPATQVLSSSRSCSSSPSIYIKDEPDSQDDETSNNGKLRKCSMSRASHRQQLKQRLQLPKSANIYATPPPHLIINANNELIDAEAGDLDDDDDVYDDDDDDEDDEDDVARGSCPAVIDVDMSGGVSPGSSLTAVPVAHHQPTAKELLYAKFGDFLAARLNTLHEPVANELMNKILILIAEK